MTATTPYLIRAIHEWCTDQGFTPYLLVDATVKDTVVPMNLVTDGTIVMNLDYDAVHHLEMGNDWILFNARFGGKPKDINIPIASVRAIYAKENGQGCVFPEILGSSKEPRLASEQKAKISNAPKLTATLNQTTAKDKAKTKGKSGPRKSAQAKTPLKGVTTKPSKKSTDKSKPSLKLVD